MIYESVSTTDAIQQGDIFCNIPRVEFTLSSLPVIDDKDALKKTTWREVLLSKRSEPVAAVLAVTPVTAIVITQNCDAVRGQGLSLCQVDNYLKVTGKESAIPKDAKKWQSLIVQTSQQNPRVFYLPEDTRFNLTEKSAVDFRVVLPVPRLDLENMRDHRVARLNPIAREHFRESLSHFFRRYAFNPWYPLTPEEFKSYQAQVDEPIPPYDWQK